MVILGRCKRSLILIFSTGFVWGHWPLISKNTGRMFVRMCPYLPFSARVCLNQHHWLAIRMTEEGIDFQQSTNAFLRCSTRTFAGTRRLPHCARSASMRPEVLAAFTPFFTDRERRQEGCLHRLFFSQVEYCDNLIFHRRAAVEEITERLLDLNRNIGQPNEDHHHLRP